MKRYNQSVKILFSVAFCTIFELFAMNESDDLGLKEKLRLKNLKNAQKLYKQALFREFEPGQLVILPAPRMKVSSPTSSMGSLPDSPKNFRPFSLQNSSKNSSRSNLSDDFDDQVSVSSDISSLTNDSFFSNSSDGLPSPSSPMFFGSHFVPTIRIPVVLSEDAKLDVVESKIKKYATDGLSVEQALKVESRKVRFIEHHGIESPSDRQNLEIHEMVMRRLYNLKRQEENKKKDADAWNILASVARPKNEVVLKSRVDISEDFGDALAQYMGIE